MQATLIRLQPAREPRRLAVNNGVGARNLAVTHHQHPLNPTIHRFRVSCLTTPCNQVDHNVGNEVGRSSKKMSRKALLANEEENRHQPREAGLSWDSWHRLQVRATVSG